MGDKDSAFKKLLKDRECFVRFLRRFVGSETPVIVEEVLDSQNFSLDDIIPEDISFIDEVLKEKRSDIVYRIRCGDLCAYVYLLIEHQSTVDFLMPYRIFSYVSHKQTTGERERSEQGAVSVA